MGLNFSPVVQTANLYVSKVLSSEEKFVPPRRTINILYPSISKGYRYRLLYNIDKEMLEGN